MLFAIKAMALAMLAVQPPAAPVPAPAADESRLVEIGFAPPPGESLRYRLTIGHPSGRSDSLILALRFDPEPGGYRLTVTHELPEALRASPAAAPTARPQRFHLSEDGDLLRMDEEEAHWDAVAQALGSAGDEASARQFVARIRALPTEARLALAAQNYGAILRYGASAWIPGAAAVQTQSLDTPLGSVPADLTATLEAIEGGTARIVTVAEPWPEQFEAMARRAAGDAAGSERLMRVERRETSLVDTATGLARRVEAVTRIEFDTPGGRRVQEQRRLLERVD